LPTTKKKKTSKKNSSTVLPQPKLYPLSSKKPEEKHKRTFHAVGVMKTEQESYHEGVYSKFTPEQIHSHIEYLVQKSCEQYRFHNTI